MQFRQAEHNDIARLLEICRVCFPRSLRWQGLKSTARRRLELLLDPQTCRAWVCRENGTIEGFAAAVLDVDLFNRQKNQVHFSFGDILVLSFTHPVLLVNKLLFRLSKRRPESKGTDVRGDGILWIELMAVSPDARRKGIGSSLLKLCFNFAEEEGKEVVKLSVKKKNYDAQRFYLNSGFTKTGESKDTFTYARSCKPETIRAS